MITIPTLAQLRTDIIADLENQYTITIPTFGKNALYVFASVWAAKLWLVYKYMALVQKNILPDTADSEANGGTLERFGRIKLGRNPFPATQGEYTVQLTGTLGTVIPASTTWKSDDVSLNKGVIFNLDSSFTLDGIDIVTVRSLTAGLETQLSIGDTITITSPIGGLDRVATVLTEATTPQAAELLSDYRSKIIQSYRLEPQGGAGADYRIWGSEVQGVKQIYPFASSGLCNVVDLFIESDSANGVPSATVIQGVKDAIELPTTTRPARKPITIDPTYQAITPLNVDITINGFLGSTADELLITQAMTDYLSDVRPFVPSIDVTSEQNDIFDTNKIIFVITSTVPGVVFTTISLVVDGNAVSTFTFTNGDIPFLTPITYV